VAPTEALYDAYEDERKREEGGGSCQSIRTINKMWPFQFVKSQCNRPRSSLP
jgi:hypothetical protein